MTHFEFFYFVFDFVIFYFLLQNFVILYLIFSFLLLYLIFWILCFLYNVFIIFLHFYFIFFRFVFKGHFSFFSEVCSSYFEGDTFYYRLLAKDYGHLKQEGAFMILPRIMVTWNKIHRALWVENSWYVRSLLREGHYPTCTTTILLWISV